MIASLALACAALAQDRPSGEILYTRSTAGTWQVWRRDLAGDVDEQVTSTGGDKRYPAWTPDGRVFYQSVNQECWIVATEPGKEPQPLLKELWPVRDVSFSPDGTKLAFARIRTDLVDASNVCVSDASGAGARWLTQEPGIQYTPCWSPDSSRLAFVSGDGWATYDVCTIRADGTERAQLAVPSTHEFLPAWSPDGSRLAFASDRTGDFEIWVAGTDGSGPKQLTERAGLDTRPTWSPDGAFLAFTRAVDGLPQVWCMRADGSEQRALIVAPAGARDAAWRVTKPAAISASAALAPLALSEISLDRKTIDADLHEPTTVRFRLSEPATARIDVVDALGSVVRRLGGERLDAGEHALAWDGLAADGTPASPGTYRYVICAQDEHGRRTIHDPSQDAWGEELKPLEFTFDREQGVLRWLMPQAGFARLRIALHDFPLLATLLDWTPLEAGRQEVRWSGLDESGLVQLRDHPKLWITLELYSMPSNALIVHGKEAARGEHAPASYAPLVATSAGAFREARKARDDSHAPQLDFEFPGATELDPQGRPIVRGIVPVRVTLSPRDLRSMTDSLFEVALYVDLVFLFEEEESTSPLTYLWDTTKLPPGPHLVTVNAFSYDGRIGALTRSVVIGERP